VLRFRWADRGFVFKGRKLYGEKYEEMGKYIIS